MRNAAFETSWIKNIFNFISFKDYFISSNTFLYGFTEDLVNYNHPAEYDTSRCDTLVLRSVLINAIQSRFRK